MQSSIFGGSSNGRTAAFEAVNFGSIPSPPALSLSGLFWKKYPPMSTYVPLG